MRNALFLFALIATSTQALNHSHVDDIDRLGSIDSRDDGDYLIVKNFTSAGTCPLSNGLVIARIRSDSNGNRSFSMALAARMSGKKVKISVDDTKRNAEGDCYLHSIEIKD